MIHMSRVQEICRKYLSNIFETFLRFAFTSPSVYVHIAVFALKKSVVSLYDTKKKEISFLKEIANQDKKRKN